MSADLEGGHGLRPSMSTLQGLLVLTVTCPEHRQLCFPIDARIVPMDASPDICNIAI